MSCKLIFVVILGTAVTLALAHPQLFAVEEQGEETEPQRVIEEEPLTRYRRDSLPAGDHHQHHGWGHKGWGHQKKGWGWPSVGPVFTYVRTDGWSNFQWGVRHKVGGGKGWGRK